MDVDGYLARLGLDRPSAPSLDWLFAVHHAQMERVPYSTLDIHLGRPGPLDPAVCVDRIARTGRTGYCLQLNGAFGALLTCLGYAVRRHRGAVWSDPAELPGHMFPNHLALTVHLDGGRWFIDAGLGDAPYEPIPLAEATVAQGPCRYRMERTDGAWRFHHDPSGAFRAMDFQDADAPADAFEHGHTVMSTSPDSNFVQNVVVARRDATGVDKLVNQTLRRIEGARVVDIALPSPAAFFAALADVFGLGLGDLDADDRALLWRDAQAGQAAYEASQAVSVAASGEGGHVPG